MWSIAPCIFYINSFSFDGTMGQVISRLILKVFIKKSNLVSVVCIIIRCFQFSFLERKMIKVILPDHIHNFLFLWPECFSIASTNRVTPCAQQSEFPDWLISTWILLLWLFEMTSSMTVEYADIRVGDTADVVFCNTSMLISPTIRKLYFKKDFGLF